MLTWKFDTGVLGYVEGYYNEKVLNTKTEDEIYEEVKAGTSYSHSDYDFTIISGLSASTNYIYCVIGYTGNGSFTQMGTNDHSALLNKIVFYLL